MKSTVVATFCAVYPQNTTKLNQCAAKPVARREALVTSKIVRHELNRRIDRSTKWGCVAVPDADGVGDEAVQRGAC